MEGNKFILFRSQLTAVLEALHGNVKRKPVEFYWIGKAAKKSIVTLFKNETSVNSFLCAVTKQQQYIIICV
jgi:hypothetical protein